MSHHTVSHVSLCLQSASEPFRKSSRLSKEVRYDCPYQSRALRLYLAIRRVILSLLLETQEMNMNLASNQSIGVI